MPVVYPTGAPVPVAVLGWDGTDFRALLVDAAHRLQIDVVDAAGIQDALQSVATDRLIVRGEDQLHSYRGALGELYLGAVSGANGYVRLGPVPAGVIWHVTNVLVRDQTTALTEVSFVRRRGAAYYLFGDRLAAIGANEWSVWRGDVWADPGDYIYSWLTGSLAGDTCDYQITGEEMTLEV